MSEVEVSISEDSKSRYLHLGTPWVQGAMSLKDPVALELEYVKRMMAWLLFTPQEVLESDAALRQLPAMQLGLGAAALTKYHAQVLAMPTTAIELNERVIFACHNWFALPENQPPALEVICTDAETEIANQRWQGKIHALQVDLYDEDAAAPVLDSASFYADCRAALLPSGCMSVNLFGRRSSFKRSLEKIVQAFGQECVWTFRPTREGNTIVLALRQAAAEPPRMTHAAYIERCWGLPARRWVKGLQAAN